MPFSAIERDSVVVASEVGERGRRRRVGQVVGRHVDRLDRGDRTLDGGRDALLQRAHVGGQRRLVAHGGGDAAEQCRYFRAGLGEAEDVVDEEQHVLALIAEVLGDGEARKPTRMRAPGRLVHLAEDQRAFGAGGGAVVLLRVLVDARFDELVIEVVALARALADAGEHRIAAVRLGDVVDQLLDDDRLADAGAAEQADLAAAGVRRQQVDDLDAGDRGSAISVDWSTYVGAGWWMARLCWVLIGPASSTGCADDVHDAAERLVADGHGDRLARVGDLLAAHQTFGRRPWRRCAPVFSPRCWATSRIRRVPWLSVASAFRMAGSWPSKCTSTTAPVTWVTRPVTPLTLVVSLAMSPPLPGGASERLGARDDFDRVRW